MTHGQFEMPCHLNYKRIMKTILKTALHKFNMVSPVKTVHILYKLERLEFELNYDHIRKRKLIKMVILFFIYIYNNKRVIERIFG